MEGAKEPGAGPANSLNFLDVTHSSAEPEYHLASRTESLKALRVAHRYIRGAFSLKVRANRDGLDPSTLEAVTAEDTEGWPKRTTPARTRAPNTPAPITRTAPVTARIGLAGLSFCGMVKGGSVRRIAL